MKLNSMAGASYHVADLDATAEFYETLGFRMGKREGDQMTCYVNWFWLRFVAEDGSGQSSHRGSGQSLHVKVDDVDEVYAAVVTKGMKPDGEPRSPSKGTREFVLSDPDGYTLVFFAKK